MTDLQHRLQTSLADRYRLEREVGQGGMATVYLAHDPRHDRPVAIKLFRPELSAVLGADRFLNEIKVTAHLQHPHILPLYDSGSADGLLYYVMPFVEGESLRQRMARERQLPIEEAVRLTREVADALDYAHRHGVIHRDIKPENILLHEGRVLVADFGIALAVQAAGGTRLTQTGLSLGTPGYMSPEQATGDRELDARSDLYSLACVLYEMLAGQPPHTGPTAQAVISKIVTEIPPPISSLRPTVPPQVEQAIHVALAKLPADRFATLAEFSDALRLDGARTTPAAFFGTGARPTGRRWRPIAAAAGVALVAGLGGVALGRMTASGGGPAALPSRLSILAGVGGTGGAAIARQIGITQDGTSIIYRTLAVDGGARVMVHKLDAPASVVLPGSIGANEIHLGPDSRQIWFGNAGGMRALPIEGGTPSPTRVPFATSSLAWGRDGTLYYNDPGTGALYRLDRTGDPVLIHPPDTAGALWIGQVLPDGRRALVTKYHTATNNGELHVLDLGSGERTRLTEAAVVEARYTSGLLVYAQPDGSLNAVPFDPARARITGRPLVLASDVSLTGTGVAQFAVAENGTLVYIPQEPRELVFIDRSGAARLATDTKRNYHSPRFSPDGRRLALDFTSVDGRDTWLLDLEQSTLTRVTFDQDGHDASWSPDGRHLTYTSARTGAAGIYRVRPGTGAPPESLLVSPALGYTGAWTPDGRLVTVFNETRPGTRQDVVAIADGGRGAIIPLVATTFDEGWPALSPGGRWLAFVSNMSGEMEVYVRPLDGDGDQVQVSRDGGTEPLWAPNGRELFYRTTSGAESQLVAAEIATSPGLRVSGRTPLFSVADIDPAQPHANYDISPDGRTFVMVRRSPATRIEVIQHLPELVRRAQGSAPR